MFEKDVKMFLGLFPEYFVSQLQKNRLIVSREILIYIGAMTLRTFLAQSNKIIMKDIRIAENIYNNFLKKIYALYD